MEWRPFFDFFGNPVIAIAAVGFAAALIAILVHFVVVKVITRLIVRRTYTRAFLRRSVGPFRLLLPALALQAVLQTAPADLEWVAGWQHVVLLATIFAVTWLALAAVLGGRDVVALRHPVDMVDNLGARRVVTQVTVLSRTAGGLVILIGVAAALTTFPDVRQIGASLLASAGLAGIVVGFAARPVLGNLLAGLQIAMAQPIRIDDVVIVQNEWGRIEDITGTYVVIRIWDERRLVVPLQWFIENPFQNWTHTSSNIIGSVFLWVDYRLPLEPLRRELTRILESAPEWDRRVATLQVTDTSERAMQVRVLASSINSGSNWDLKCRVREGLISFIQREHADALPLVRAQFAEAAPPHREMAVARGSTDSHATAQGQATLERV